MSAAPRLRLTIRNVDMLDNGVATTIELAQRNAIIGRSQTADWCLPDPRSYISSRHCEISFAGGAYRLTDCSTNGTFLNGAAARMPSPAVLMDGDVLLVGHYEIVAHLVGAAEAPPPPPPPASPGWNGWEAPAPLARQPGGPAGWDPLPDAPAPPAPARDDWGPPPSNGRSGAATPGWDPLPEPSGGTGPAAPTPWDIPETAPDPASPWSSGIRAEPQAPTAEDVWGKLAGSYDVDWSRGGFAAAAPSLEAAAQDVAFVPPSVAVAPQPAPAAAPAPAPAAALPAQLSLEPFLRAAGIDSAAVQGDEGEVMAAAGGLLRRLAAGLVVMLEARARAKAQMGAQTTIFSRDGNNPLKFARTPEAALIQLLNPPVSGYMPADRAVEDSFRDLQTHQLATLKAMQGALRATLARFSPESIRKRAQTTSRTPHFLPNAREAALWRAYEREFGGVAQGSDEAFMEVFAKEFRRAYEEQASR